MRLYRRIAVAVAPVVAFGIVSYMRCTRTYDVSVRNTGSTSLDVVVEASNHSEEWKFNLNPRGVREIHFSPTQDVHLNVTVSGAGATLTHEIGYFEPIDWYEAKPAAVTCILISSQLIAAQRQCDTQ